jgi:hypothetical protein
MNRVASNEQDEEELVQTLAIFAACIAAFALPASSDAAHGVPAKARTLTAELVPWYYTTDTETVTVTSNGLTAYSLVRSHSCSFGPGGSGKVSFKVIEGDIAVTARLKRLAESCEGMILKLSTAGALEQTIDDCGDQTCMTGMYGPYYGECVVAGGSCEISTTINTEWTSRSVSQSPTSVFLAGRSSVIRLGDIVIEGPVDQGGTGTVFRTGLFIP